jgi:hypothetical protein
MPWSLLAQIAIPLIAVAVSWGVLTTRVSENQRAIDSLYSRTAALEGGRDRIGGLEERVTSAAQRAQDAKQLAERLLDDRLRATCKGD